MPSSHHQEQTRSKMKVTLTWKTVEMAGQMPSKWSCKDTLAVGKKINEISMSKLVIPLLMSPSLSL